MNGEQRRMDYGWKALPICLIGLLILHVAASAAGALKPHPKWPPADAVFYYGSLADPATLDKVSRFDLAVVHSDRDMQNLTSERVLWIRQGADQIAATADDTIVIAYITIGEDDNPPGGPPVAGEESGPCFYQDGKGLRFAEKGYPSRFLDERAQRLDDPVYLKLVGGKSKKNGESDSRDGLPDENSSWRSYYVNPGDPQWRKMVFDRLEILAATGVDGFFLDTIGTCSPWGKYPYLQQEMAKLVADIHAKFPDHYLIANRGYYLLNNETPEFGPSIDGLLFENFMTEWDDEENKGYVSPYLQSNLQVLRDQLLDVVPEIQIFFLEYISLDQPDLAFLMHTQRSLLRELPSSTSAYGDPSLQEIYPKREEFFPDGTHRILPRIQSMKLDAVTGGRFTADILVDRKPDVGTMLDFHISNRKSVAEYSPQFPSVPMNLINTEQTDEGFLLQYQGEGLKRGIRYSVWARFIGPGLQSASEFVTGRIKAPEGSWPDQVTDFKVWREDSGVRIDWLHPTSGADRYRISGGPVGSEDEITLEVQGPPLQIGRLVNGQKYRFHIQAVSSHGEAGPLTLARIVTPRLQQHDEEGELKPVQNVQAEVTPDGIHIHWQALENKLRGYRVYVIPVKEKYRLPLFCRENDLITRKAQPGKYRIYVTAVNWDRNEGPLSEPVEVNVK